MHNDIAPSPAHGEGLRILITGASGFIGSYIVEEALTRGFEVWAGVRSTSSRRYLSDPRIHFANLNLDDPRQLCEQLQSYGRFDYIVHAAGATKCRCEDDFFRTNTRGTRHLIEALISTQLTPRRFIFISSLSIFGAVREEPYPYTPILDTDTPQPNTAYGRSKLEAERHLRTITAFPWVILRPTGVYGPRERDYFLMAQSIKQHVDFAVGYRPQDITFVYVQDVVQAVFLALTAPDAAGKAFFLSDGQVYDSRRFSDLLQQEMGTRCVLHIKAPLWFLRIICAVAGRWGKLTGSMTALNPDKYHILAQRNWQCDIQPARTTLGYTPQWPLERGVAAAVQWYKQEGWL